MIQRTAEQWGVIYDVLIKEVQAPSSQRDSFIHHCAHEQLTEWRLQGSLGFGGKIWLRHDGRVDITCYREDESSARRVLIRRVNKLLAKL